LAHINRAAVISTGSVAGEADVVEVTVEVDSDRERTAVGSVGVGDEDTVEDAVAQVVRRDCAARVGREANVL